MGYTPRPTGLGGGNIPVETLTELQKDIYTPSASVTKFLAAKKDVTLANTEKDDAPLYRLWVSVCNHARLLDFPRGRLYDLHSSELDFEFARTRSENSKERELIATQKHEITNKGEEPKNGINLP